MEIQEIIERLEAKLDEIHSNADQGLQQLTDRWADTYKHVNTMYDCDIGYYHNVARFAWHYRGKKIAALEIGGLLNQLKQELTPA